MKKKQLWICGIIVFTIMLLCIVTGISRDPASKEVGNTANTLVEKIIKNTEPLSVNELYFVANKPEGTTANQGFAVIKDVLFQLYSDNYVVLSDFKSGEQIAQFEIASLHGDTMDFSNEYYYKDDEFPLAYITADTNPAQVFVVRITRTEAKLIRTYFFSDIEETGYYAGHCLDAENRIIYLVGYKTDKYYIEDGNCMIVSSWDIDNCIENEDGTVTPRHIESFEIPFIITVQGQRVYHDKLFLLSSHNGNGDIAIETKIVIVDPNLHSIVASYSIFPTIIKNTECEGIEFVGDDNKPKIILSTYDISNGMYFALE